MNAGVRLTQSYLHLNGYFTVSELPVIRQGRAGEYREVTDLDLLALRYPRAEWVVPRGRPGGGGDLRMRADPLLVQDREVVDVIIAEVKEGKARINDTLRSRDALQTALRRVGCCPEALLDRKVEELQRGGRAELSGHEAGIPTRIRLVAFGSGQSGHREGFEEAGVRHEDIKYASIYDSFTITVLMQLEDLGFCEKGQGGKFVSDGNLISGQPMFTDAAMTQVDTAAVNQTIAMVAAGTALIAGLLTLAMGIIGRFPVGLAAGLGLNALVAYVIAPQMTWGQAMGLVVWEGILMAILVLTGFRTAVFRAVPKALRHAISVGIGLFIAFVGLMNAGIVRKPAGAPPVELGINGSLASWPIAVFFLGFLPPVLSAAASAPLAAFDGDGHLGDEGLFGPVGLIPVLQPTALEHRTQVPALPTARAECRRTPRVEGTAVWWSGGVGDLPTGKVPGNAAGGIRVRNRLQQGPGVGVLGIGEDLLGGPDLHDPPEVHDRHPVAEELRGGEVVGDVDVGEVQVAPKLQHQLEDLELPLTLFDRRSGGNRLHLPPRWCRIPVHRANTL